MILRLSIILTPMAALYVTFLASFVLADIANQNEKSFKVNSGTAIKLAASREDVELKRLIWMVLSKRAPDISASDKFKITSAIVRYSKLHGHDPFLLMAVVETESAYKPLAVSRKGAVGLMQIRPFVAISLAGEMRLNKQVTKESLYDPNINLKIGAYYLAKMKRKFGDLSLALEAYNQGPTKLRVYIKKGVHLKKKYTKKVLRYKKEITRAL